MCDQEKCEYQPTYDRRLTRQRTADEIRYAELWREIELPKLLEEKKRLEEQFIALYKSLQTKHITGEKTE